MPYRLVSCITTKASVVASRSNRLNHHFQNHVVTEEYLHNCGKHQVSRILQERMNAQRRVPFGPTRSRRTPFGTRLYGAAENVFTEAKHKLLK